jgi:acetyltransferase-like isoleucine patch superfamily enzyme
MEPLVKFFILSFKVYFFFKNRLLKAYIRYFKKAFDYAYLTYFGVETKYGYVDLVGFPIIRKHPKSQITIGKGVTLVSRSEGNVAGINHPVILSTLSENSYIRLEEFSGISGSAIVAKKGILIKSKSGLGANASVYDTDFHVIDPKERLISPNENAKSKEVIIGRNVWIGANSTILKGVVIGDDSVVGACSLVISDIPSSSLFAGNPARMIRQL